MPPNTDGGRFNGRHSPSSHARVDRRVRPGYGRMQLDGVVPLGPGQASTDASEAPKTSGSQTGEISLRSRRSPASASVTPAARRRTPCTPPIYAECKGLPAKYGLEIEWLSFDGGSAAAQALLAEQVDVADNSGGPAIASLATDSPMIIAYVTRDNLTDNLYSSPASNRPMTCAAVRSPSRASGRSRTRAPCWR